MNHVSAQWRRSSYCANGACLEMAWTQGEQALVRDSKLDGGAASPVLAFGGPAWRSFLDGVKADDFRS
jgi:hypothetical protein